MRVYLLFLTLTLLAILTSCSPSDKKINDFARFNAKRSIINEYSKLHPESLSVYLKGLYESEKMDSVRIGKMVAYLDSNPEEWVKFQKMIVLNLDTLNPAKAVKK
ncbi:MAG: hypothetical protein JNL74_05660 [Fibrobacteres bacterium]|nr:hypothetical protein [Fibrobacterota bacterium]